MKIVTIGSGVIVEEFIKAAKQVENVEILGTYSRTIERAKEFALKMDVKKYYDSYDAIIGDEEVDFVYIATPNALHFNIAKYMLEHHKHVIIEKPIMSLVENAKILLDIAKKNNLFIFEAISNIHTPNFEVVKEYITKIGDIRLVNANYSQYSSRYDLFKAGELPNVFNPEFSGGVLMDLNIYNIQLIYNLFGLPLETNYFPNIVRGIDTSGILIMQYDGFIASATAAKDSEAQCIFSVQGDDGFIKTLSPTNELTKLHIKTKDEEFHIDYNLKHRLYHEIETFEAIFRAEDYKKTYEKFDSSIEVLSILEKSWKENNLNFSDK